MKTQLSIIFLIILISFAQNSYQFKQWQSDRYNIHVNEPLPYIYGWDTLPFTQVVNIVSTYKNTVWFQATYQDGESDYLYELYSYDKKDVIQITGTGYIPINSKFFTQDIDDQTKKMTLLVASEESVYKYSCQQQECRVRQSLKDQNFGQVYAIDFSSQNQSYLIATETGLYELPSTSFKNYKKIVDQKVTSLSVNNDLNIRAYTTTSKLIFNFEISNTSRFEYLKGLSYVQINALSWRIQDQTLWVGSSKVTSVFQFYKSSFFKEGFYYINWQLSGQQGLPVAEISAIQVDQNSNKVFLGGKYGVSVFDGEIQQITAVDDFTSKKQWQGVQQYASPQSPWKYFYQQRWMPTGSVLNYSLNEFGGIWVLTQYGVAHIYHEELTFEEKEAHNEQIIKDRHSILGYVTNANLKKPGDLSTSEEQQTSDNQGLWTNLYLAALSYKYKVTQDENVKKQAWEIFQSMERNYAVIPPKFYGLMAKAVMIKQDTLPDEKWRYSTNKGYEQFMYKGNASSDDVTSYFYAFPIFMEYVCETQTEKDLVLSYLIRTIDYIIENNYQLINVDGERTMWGFWDPEDLNNNPEYYSEKCLNSMEILSFLAVAYKYTGNEKYSDEMNKFIKYGYIQNSLNWRYQDPADVNFSDDELGYMSLGAFFMVYEDQKPEFQQAFLQNLIRTFSIVQEYQPSWYIYITALSLAQNKSTKQYYSKIITQDLLDQAKQELTDWPTDWINWSVDNSQRLDLSKMRNPLEKYIEKNPNLTFMNYAIKKGERADNFYWNSDPYVIVNNGINGGSEFSTQPWLLPYWMSQYLEQIENDDIFGPLMVFANLIFVVCLLIVV